MSVLNLKNRISKKFQEGKAEIKDLEDKKGELVEQVVEIKDRIGEIDKKIAKIEAEFSILENLLGVDEEIEEEPEEASKPYFGK